MQVIFIVDDRPLENHFEKSALKLQPGDSMFYICVVCCAKLLQWCLILCDPMDCSQSGSSVHGILQAKAQE